MSDRHSTSVHLNSKRNYMILITVIIAAGLSQGLLLPVLSILLEQKGVTSSINGLNAAALYIGSFGMTLVAERTLGAIGFKKLIAAGLSLKDKNLYVPHDRLSLYFSKKRMPSIKGRHSFLLGIR